MIDVVTQLLIPGYGSAYTVWDLTSMIVSEHGLALPPLNYLTQRGPYQHGDTVVGMRTDPRTIQIVLSKQFNTVLDYHLSRRGWIASLSPVNTGDALSPVRPYLYRKLFYDRFRLDLADLQTENGSAQIYSASAKFVQNGLAAGAPFVIDSGADAGNYIIASIENENTLTLTVALTADDTAVTCHFYTGTVARELEVFVEDAPKLDIIHTSLTRSRKEVLRLVAHDPIWRDTFVQTITWTVDISGNLIFYESPDWTDRAVFPIWFSGDFIYSQTSLVYAGTWPTRPSIQLSGPFATFKLINVSTGDMLILNYAAVQGETITIDLYALRAYNQLGADLTNNLYTSGTQDSDLVTFQLAPHPIVNGGVNVLSIEMQNALPNVTQAVMTWQSRYIGV